jgi:hypothetical protein
MTPFLIDLACAYSPAIGVAFGPWDFHTSTCELTFYGEVVEALGWRDMEAMAGSDLDARRWLEVTREDVERRLRHRAEVGSLWD